MRTFLLAMLVCALTACGGPQDAPSAPTTNDTFTIYTTFYPTTYLAERLAGSDATVTCPVPPDADPIFWRPDAETVSAYQQADLIVVNGAEFEKWALTTSLPDARVVNTAKPFAAEWLTFESATEHTHGPSGKHAHEGIDGHTWLDPVLAKAQAAAIADALIERMPESAAMIAERRDALDADLDALLAAWEAASAAYEGEVLLASHPAYNYLARRLGWKVTNLDLDPEVMPSDEALEEIATVVAAHPVRFLLWESAPLQEIIDVFRQRFGIESLEVSPCEMAAPDSDADYLAKMRQNIETLRPALKPAR